VDPEANQISDRTGVTGSHSTSIRPVTSGNWTHRRQRIAKLARNETRGAFHLRDFLDRRVRDGSATTSMSEALP
jgi:hypothetical protein